MDLFDEFSSIIAALEDGDIPYAVCGGMAMAIHIRNLESVDP